MNYVFEREKKQKNIDGKHSVEGKATVRTSQKSWHSKKSQHKHNPNIPYCHCRGGNQMELLGWQVPFLLQKHRAIDMPRRQRW